MVVLVWFIDYLTGEEWSRQKRGCVGQEQPLSTVWRLVNYIYPDCYIVSWSQPGPGPGNTHNWKLDSYVDWLCERNQALVSWGWFRVCQEGENRECPVNECVYSQWLASDFNVHLGKLEHLAVSPLNASVQLYHTFFGLWRRNFETCLPLLYKVFLAKSALLTAIQTWSGDDIKLGLRSHLKWISLKLASQIN